MQELGFDTSLALTLYVLCLASRRVDKAKRAHTMARYVPARTGIGRVRQARKFGQAQ